MNLVIEHHTPRNVWSVGQVGTVGETNYQVRLAQSCPELEPRYSKIFNGKAISKISKPVGTLPTKIDKKGPNTSCVGWFKQDLIPVDVSQIATMGSVGRYRWNNQRAQVLKAKVTGDYFLPTPGGYGSQMANGVLRGNAYPQPIFVAAGSTAYGTQTATTQTDSGTEKNKIGLFGNVTTETAPVGGVTSAPGGAFMATTTPSKLNPSVGMYSDKIIESPSTYDQIFGSRDSDSSGIYRKDIPKLP